MAQTPRFTPTTLAAVRAFIGDPTAFDLKGKDFVNPKSLAALNLDPAPDKQELLDGLKAAQRLYRVKPDLDLVLDLMALSAYLQSR
jgi:hypothetical protein